jgi:hypothetical protein
VGLGGEARSEHELDVEKCIAGLYPRRGIGWLTPIYPDVLVHAARWYAAGLRWCDAKRGWIVVATDVLQFEPLFAVTAGVATELQLDGTPRGRLRVDRFTFFECAGGRFAASLNPVSAAEWTVTGPDGTATAEGRVTLTTADGDGVYVRWIGRWDALVEGPFPPRIAVRFEGEGAAAWLGPVLAVGVVHHDGNRRQYELYELAVLPPPIEDANRPCRLEPLLVLDNTVDLAHLVALPYFDSGRRLIGALVDARCRGPRVHARLRSRVAGDWAAMNPLRSVSMDVIETLETDDGALVHLTYQGSGDISGGGLYSAPTYVIGLFEAGDERYTWLNSVLAVGEGRHQTGRAEVVTYHFYEVL